MTAVDDLEQRKRRALGLPGREYKESLYPPIGRLSFEKILHMTEDEVDTRIALHLQDEEIFREESYLHPASADLSGKPHALEEPGTRPIDVRRLELKKAGLAMLEGYSPKRAPLSKWYRDSYAATSPTATPASGLAAKISRHVSTEFKDRRKHVLTLLKDAELFAPREENRNLLAKINEHVVSSGHPPFELHEIVTNRFSHLRPDDKTSGSRWDLQRVLQLYLHLLEGHDVEQIVKDMRIPNANVLYVVASTYLKDEAKKLLPQIKGRYPR